MLRILKYKWAKNEDKLRESLSKLDTSEYIEYRQLVKLTFDVIFNSDGGVRNNGILDVDKITVVDDGEYQGCQLFLIPFDTYQPDETEYLMTYQDYGSCSGCDTLQNILMYCDKNPSGNELNRLLDLCRDLIMRTIKPYTGSWYGQEGDFDQIDIDERKIE